MELHTWVVFVLVTATLADFGTKTNQVLPTGFWSTRVGFDPSVVALPVQLWSFQLPQAKPQTLSVYLANQKKTVPFHCSANFLHHKTPA